VPAEARLSAADPPAPREAGPIALGDGPRAVLLLHGLTGTPYEVRPFALALHARGFAVRAPLLAGHADLDALERSGWRDWYGSAEAALRELLDAGARVLVLGFSMGGLLALRLAALRRDAVAGLVVVSVPIEQRAWERRAIGALAALRRNPLGRRFVGLLAKHGGRDVRVQREATASPSLDAFPYPALAELVALQDEVGELLPHVRAPLLVVHGRLDHTAPVEHGERISMAVGSSRVERLVLPRSFHLVGLDLDREHAGVRIVDFALSVLGDPAVPKESKP
jgi:carboxylesterase